MPLIMMKRYTRQIIQENPDWLFVFGDNLERAGYGGQARAARGEPNAVGIVTKRKPYHSPDAYFSDDDLDEYERANAGTWEKLFDVVEDGGTVVWPEDGIGTGLARLGERAPRLMTAIELRLSKLKERIR